MCSLQRIYYLALLAIAALSSRGYEPPNPGPVDDLSTSSQKTKNEREMTFYTAKQAFGRLVLYLDNRKQPAPLRACFAIPERSAINSYSSGERLGVVVGAWMIGYEDDAGISHQAKMNSWGDITVTQEKTDWGKSYVGSIRPDQWILDNTDAHVIALNRGAIANSGNFGGWMQAVEVAGRARMIGSRLWCNDVNDPNKQRTTNDQYKQK